MKVRGFRIELGEIETALSQHSALQDALVIAREDTPGEKRLVAYIVGDAETRALRDHMRHSVPEYMMPSACVASTLPLSAAL